MPTTFASSASAVTALRLHDVGLLTDADLLAAVSVIATHRASTDALTALLAGEIHRRSPRDAGYSGLAQRNGHASAEKLLQATTPITRAEAVSFVQVGRLLDVEPSSLWESALAQAVAAGLAVARAEAIRHGLMEVSETTPAVDLERACVRLIARASLTSVDELRREARTARDQLDEAGIARREGERRDRRFLKYWVRDDGMYQGSFLLDPENGQRVCGAFDAVVAPRRGVRFRDQGAAGTIVDDARSTAQLLADALVELVQVAVDTDPGKLFGTRRPAVRVVVTADTLTGTGGHGYLEGDRQPLSRDSVDRFICDVGVIGVKFDRRNQIVDLGRTQRLFSEPQRLAISTRDGGCLFPECTAPPSRCEVHHIIPWHKNGNTDACDGVLLCRHHHMLLHTRHWQITRDDGTYRLDRGLPEPVLLPTKSPLMRELVT